MNLTTPDKPSGEKPDDSLRGFNVNSTEDVYEAKGARDKYFN